MNADFFKAQTDSSRIKANIVAEYFPSYAKILLKRPQKEIRYLDLFAGPGLYEDKSESTPLLIGRRCADDPLLATKVRLLFNDNYYKDELEINFQENIGLSKFSYPPRFGSETVGESEKIRKYLLKQTGKNNPYPTLLFFDPWGYKGIDTLVLAQFLENWGNEIFLFVNIKRIHAAIENDKFDSLMQMLFPTSFHDLKKSRKYKGTVYERLNLIMGKLSDEFSNASKGKLYHCAFKFQEEDSRTTSHYIVHFTKHPKGYELAKQVYYTFDNIGASLDKEGNYTFDAKAMDSNGLFDFGDQNISDLSNSLYQQFKGKQITAKKLFDIHHPRTKYCGSHYVRTLRKMNDDQLLTAKFTDGLDHKVSVLLTSNCILKFKN